MTKPQRLTTQSREVASFGGDHIAFNEKKDLWFRVGGLTLKVHFESAMQGLPLKLEVEVIDKIKTDVFVAIIDDHPTLVGDPSKTEKKNRTLLRDTYLTKVNPATHIAERSGTTSFNLILEADVKNEDGVDIEFLLIVRPDNDHIVTMPDLSGLKTKVPQFAIRNPACFPRS